MDSRKRNEKKINSAGMRYHWRVLRLSCKEKRTVENILKELKIF